jgi:hypothetical protein
LTDYRPELEAVTGPKSADTLLAPPPSKEMTVAELLAWSGNDHLDEVTARDVTGLLRWRGLRARPDLFSVLAEEGEEQWRSAFDSSGLRVAGERLEQTKVTVSATLVPAQVGVALASLVAALITWYDSVHYSLLAVTAGAAAGVVLWRWFGLLDRELPVAVPRSGVLGAGLATLFIGTMLIGVAALRWIAGL